MRTLLGRDLSSDGVRVDAAARLSCRLGVNSGSLNE
jgi:hypothetical protein